MKKTKMNLRKVLSTFLAVLMLVTSCSAAFGVSAFDNTTVNMDALTELAELIGNNMDLVAAIYNQDSSVCVIDECVNYPYNLTYTDQSNDTTNLDKEIYFYDYADYYVFLELLEASWYAADYVFRYNTSDEARKNGIYDASVQSTSEVYGENSYSLMQGVLSRITSQAGYDLGDFSKYIEYFLELVFVFTDDTDGIYGKLDNKAYDNSSWGEKLSDHDTTEYSYLNMNITAYTDDAIGWFDYNDAADYADMTLKCTYTLTMHRVSKDTSVFGTGTYYRFWGFDDTEQILSTDKPVVSDTTAATNVIDALDDYQP